MTTLTAAAIGFGVCLAGFIASFWLPEPPVETAPGKTQSVPQTPAWRTLVLNEG